MTEKEYSNVYNLALIRSSMGLLSDVCGGSLSSEDMQAISRIRHYLWEITDKLHKTLDPEEEGFLRMGKR